MSTDLVGFAESLDPAAAFVNFAAISDPHVAVSGDQITIPEFNMIGAVGVCAEQTIAIQARFATPSLRQFFELYVHPIASGLTFGQPPEINNFFHSPLQLVTGERMELEILSNPGSAAVHYGLVWLVEAPPVPVTGDIRTVRATAGITLSATAWVNGALTFPATLPAGRYQLVGARVESANLVAARFYFKTQSNRPGCPGANNEPDHDDLSFRYGRLGVWGEFDHDDPPTMDCLGVTDSAEEVFLDLIKIS